MNPDKKQIEQFTEEKSQYDKIEKEYSALAEVDPSKKYVQYPSALRLLGEIENKSILDIGCGDGIFSRQLAHHGAKVAGYDISGKQISKAQEAEKAEQLDINYEVADPKTFVKDAEFDKAVSVLVLLYAKDKDDLKNFFLSAFNHLKDGSEFVSITFNPDFKRLDKTAYNRRFSKDGGGQMKVEFFNKNKEQTFSASFSDFSVQDHEDAAKEAGFKEILWEKLKIEEAGKNELGEDFWDEYEEDCPYIGLVVKK